MSGNIVWGGNLIVRNKKGYRGIKIEGNLGLS